MKKMILKNALLLNLSAILCAVSAHAQNVVIDCSVPNEQCNALYRNANTWNAGATNPQIDNRVTPAQVAPIARSSTAPLAVSQPYKPQTETLIMVNGQPVVQQTVTAPMQMPGPAASTLQQNTDTAVGNLNPNETFAAGEKVPDIAADT